VSADVDAWGYARRRAALRALKCEVIVYEPGHTPARGREHMAAAVWTISAP
jgi:hypothetical protein